MRTVNVNRNDIYNFGESTGKTMSYIFKFGVHKGKVITDARIENSYLESLIRYNEEQIKVFSAELERRAAVENATDSMAIQIIQAGYRALAKQYHPDMGGDPATFQELVGTKSILTEVVEKLK